MDNIKKFELLGKIYEKQKLWAVGSDINKINDSIKKIGLESDLKITLQRNKFKNLELDLPSSLGVRAPISRDQKLDELILLSNGERIQSYDLVAITDVKKKSFISALWDNLIFSIYSFFMQDETI